MQSRNLTVKSPFPHFFFRAGGLDPILIPSSFSKSSVFPTPHGTRKRRFQKISLWRAFSKSCVFGDRFHPIRVDKSRIRNEKVPFSIQTKTDTCGRGLKLIRDLLRELNSVDRDEFLSYQRLWWSNGPRSNVLLMVYHLN